MKTLTEKMREAFVDLNEVTVIPTGLSSQPLMDRDTVRVYHGTSSIDFSVSAVINGFTGDMRANRKFSYESNNNPKGLFVTPDLKTAKEFGSIVIEFHTRVSELESPVWPGGTFTVQGGMSGIFNDNQERELERMRQRGRFSQSEMEFIRKSDRPELAAIFLASGERQALFTGSVNAQAIRAVWVAPDMSRVSSIQTFERLSPRDFIKKIQSGSMSDQFGGRVQGIDRSPNTEVEKGQARLVTPREDIDIEEFITRLQQKHRTIGRVQVIRILKDNEYYIRKNVWSDRQADKLIRELKRL